MARLLTPQTRRRSGLTLLGDFSWLALFVLLAFFGMSRPLSAQTALTQHAPSLASSSTVNGSVQQMTGEGVTLAARAVVTGELIVPGTPGVVQNKGVTFGGTIVGTGSASPTGYQVTLAPNSQLGHLRTRVNPSALPSVSAPPAPTGTRSVTLNVPGQSAGDFSTLRDLSLGSNVGQVAVPAGTYGNFSAAAGSGFALDVAGASQPAVYNFQSLSLSGNSPVTVLGPVIITVAGDLTCSGSMGSSSKPQWLLLKLSSGGLTLSSGAVCRGFVWAPNGTVTLAAGAQLTGNVAANQLSLANSAVLNLQNQTVNQPPVANGQSVTLYSDSSASILLSGSDPDGDSVTFKIATQPAHGSLSGSGAQWTYSPAHGFQGGDSFAFVTNDGQSDS